MATSLTTQLTGGAANAYTLTPNPAITGYEDGMRLRVRFHIANTSRTVNLNINGLGNRRIYQHGTTNPVIGQIQANSIRDLVYNGSGFEFVGQPSVMPTRNTFAVDASVTASGYYTITQDRTLIISGSFSRITGTFVSGNTLATLPSGYRPPSDISVPAIILIEDYPFNHVPCHVAIRSDGRLDVYVSESRPVVLINAVISINR